MDVARPFWTVAWTNLALGLGALVVGLAGGDPFWFPVHGALLTFGTVLPILAWLHVVSIQRFVGGLERERMRMHAGAFLLGTLVTAVPFAFGRSFIGTAGPVVGLVILTVAAVNLSRDVLGAMPKTSVVDEERDPLTKGDDACWKHVKFAHFFLPAGLGLLAMGALDLPASSRLTLAGAHLLLVGYGLLSLYGLGHLWVPRFSGVPAIAAGAIKGELHTTLLGLVGLLLGFLTGWTGFLLGLGPFVFLGFFTYMGVLGANIMRNKSRTQRVTPEFVYIPWTFAGVFWLISGVLMGIFLNVVPDAIADKAAALRWLHIHITLFGGVVVMLLGWGTRLWSADRDPPRFAGAMKGAFYALNAGLATAAVARLGTGSSTTAMWVAVALTIAGFGAYLWAMAAFLKTTGTPARA